MTQHTTFAPSPDLLQMSSRSARRTTVDQPVQATLSVIASVTNLRQMAQAYGEAFAAHALRILHDRANALGFVDTCTVVRTEEHLLFSFDMRAHAQRLMPSGVNPGAYLIDRILLSLGNEPVAAGDTRAYPAIVAEVVPAGTRPEAIIEKSVCLQYGQPFTQWRRQYQANTTTARRVFGALASGRLDFDFEPIYDLRTGGEPLYYEALLCERTDGQLRHIGSSVAAIEQLGLARRLDHWVVRSIIARLRALPRVRLGCNISMQSAIPDAWWALAFATLADEPDLACRLTVEITETAVAARPEAVIGFVRKLQSLGCKVALDDIGAGFSCLQQLTNLDADVAKIDRSFLVAAREDHMAALRLGQLVGFARTCTNSVIIEGIETDADANLACASGATGLQGHLFRSGAYGPDVARLLQLPGSQAAHNG